MPKLDVKELEQWLTVSEAARALGLSRQGTYPYIEDGSLRAIKTHAGHLVEPQSVERLKEVRRRQKGDGR